MTPNDTQGRPPDASNSVPRPDGITAAGARQRASQRVLEGPGSDGLIGDYYGFKHGAYICRRCNAGFKCKDWPRLLETLQAHRATCREAWERGKTAVRAKRKTSWRCPFCFVWISHHQAARFLLEVISAHVAEHAPDSPAAHRCGACGSSCSG
jgi:hypothetical protein